MKILATLLLLALPGAALAQTITPEQLRAQLDERSGSNSAFRAMLNDPDPARSRAAMELMVESKDPQLVRLAIDHGLLSALPEVRAFALRTFLETRPTILIEINLPKELPEDFDRNFRDTTDGTILPDGTAAYRMNIGDFDPEQNCFLETRQKWCGVQVTPNGLAIGTKWHGYNDRWTFSNLTFKEDGTLSGATTVWGIKGGFPSTLQLTP